MLSPYLFLRSYFVWFSYFVLFVWLLLPVACQPMTITNYQDDSHEDHAGRAFFPVNLAGENVILAKAARVSAWTPDPASASTF